MYIIVTSNKSGEDIRMKKCRKVTVDIFIKTVQNHEIFIGTLICFK